MARLTLGSDDPRLGRRNHGKLDDSGHQRNHRHPLGILHLHCVAGHKPGATRGVRQEKESWSALVTVTSMTGGPVTGGPVTVGSGTGTAVGEAVGTAVGTAVGDPVGTPVGRAVGSGVGAPVADGAGTGVGGVATVPVSGTTPVALLPPNLRRQQRRRAQGPGREGQQIQTIASRSTAPPHPTAKSCEKSHGRQRRPTGHRPRRSGPHSTRSRPSAAPSPLPRRRDSLWPSFGTSPT